MYVFNVTHLFLEDILCLFPGGGNMKVKCMKHCPLYVGSYTLYRKFQGQSIATLEILKFLYSFDVFYTKFCILLLKTLGIYCKGSMKN